VSEELVILFSILLGVPAFIIAICFAEPPIRYYHERWSTYWNTRDEMKKFRENNPK